MPLYQSEILSDSDSTSFENATSRLPSDSWIASAGRLAQRVLKKLDSLPAISVSLKALAFVLVLSWYAFSVVPTYSVQDPDLGWHLRSGEWIVQHHQLPRTDPFSITGAGKTWIPYSWPFSVLIYEIAKNFDFSGVVVFTILSWVIAVVAIFLLCRSQKAGFWRAVTLTLVSGIVLRQSISPRPGNVTIFSFILVLYFLLRERNTGQTRTLWLVPLIFWIWANVHVQFVYGLFVLGLFCIEPLIDRLFIGTERAHRISARLWSVLALSTFATCLNPYGLGAYRVVLDFIRQPFLAGLIVETNPVSFVSFEYYLVLLIALGAAAVLAYRRPVEPFCIVLFLWATISPFRMDRDIWLLAVVGSALLAMPLRIPAVAPKEPSRLWLYGTIGVVLVVLVGIRQQPRNSDLLARVSQEYPVGAVAYIHKTHLPGPIFNEYDWGGFLTYALPEYPVSIDGRTNVHDQREVARSSRTWLLRPGWDQNPLFRQANLIIGSPIRPLTNHLETDSHFRVVFRDRTAVVFQRISAAPE